MKTISRRTFLRFTGTGIVIAATPKILLAAQNIIVPDEPIWERTAEEIEWTPRVRDFFIRSPTMIDVGRDFIGQPGQQIIWQPGLAGPGKYKLVGFTAVPLVGSLLVKQLTLYKSRPMYVGGRHSMFVVAKYNGFTMGMNR